MPQTIDMAAFAESIITTRPKSSRERKGVKQARLKKIIRQIAKLRLEGLSLYRAFPTVAKFHESLAKWRVLTGSNRSGKSRGGAAEAARAWCGCDPYDKYPKTNGSFLVVAKEGDQLALLWRILANPGAFYIIQDEHTGLYRALRPDPDNPAQLAPYDEAYREKWREAPPLIPPRMLKHVSWEDRGKGIPRVAELVTGWRGLFRSGNGESPQGDYYNHVWFDEDFKNEEFYNEAVRGLASLGAYMPRGIWTATPQTSNYQLTELYEKAGEGSTYAESFQVFVKDNPIIPPDEKQSLFDGWSEEEREYRWYGRFPIHGRRIYASQYDPMGPHGCEPRTIPDDCTRFCVIDPARQHCGTIFAAVDPDEAHVEIYESFDLLNANAGRWGDEIAKRSNGHQFEACVMDKRHGRTHQTAQDDTVAWHYFKALQDRGITPKTAGPLDGFFPGSDDVSAREEALLAWMRIRGDGPFAGTSVLQVHRGVNDRLDKQIKRAHYEFKKTERRAKLREDILDCLEYLAAFGPYYTPPPTKVTDEQKHRVYYAFKRKQKRLRDKALNNRSPGVVLE